MIIDYPILFYVFSHLSFATVFSKYLNNVHSKYILFLVIY